VVDLGAVIIPSYMPWNSSVTSTICARCLYRQLRVSSPSTREYNVLRNFSSSSALPQQAEQPAAASKDEASDGAPDIAAENTKEQGAMSRRLAEMTDETIEQGGRSAQTTVGESGFSEELKRQLEQKILDSRFKSDNSAALAQLNMPVSPFALDVH
jgi:hypothetical protein